MVKLGLSPHHSCWLFWYNVKTGWEYFAFHNQHLLGAWSNHCAPVGALVDEPKGTLGIAKEERGEFLQTVALAVSKVVGDELSSLHAEGGKAIALLGGTNEEGEGYLSEVETGDVRRLGNFCEFCAVTAV